jgi:hypothetical protein
MASTPVTFDTNDRVFVVTLYRPPANALGMPIIDGLHCESPASTGPPSRWLRARRWVAVWS